MTLLARKSARQPGGVALPSLADLMMYEKEQHLCKLVRGRTLLEEHRAAQPWCELGSRRAYLEHQNSASGWAPLHVAASLDKHELCRAIAACGVRVDLTDHHGRTALMVAASYGHHNSVSALLEVRASHEAADHVKKQALHHTVGCGNNAADIVSMLLRTRAEIDARDSAGLTPLALAAAMQDAASVETLLKHGATSLAFDGTGRTHLEHARTSRRYPGGGRPCTAPASNALAELSTDAAFQGVRLAGSVGMNSEANSGRERTVALGSASIPRPVTARELPARTSEAAATWNYPRHDHKGDVQHQQLLLHADRSARRRLMPVVRVAERDRLHAGKALLC